MNVASVLTLLLQYGPGAVAMAQKLIADIETGKGQKEVTAADLAELVALGNQTASDIYKRLGIAPPPEK